MKNLIIRVGCSKFNAIVTQEIEDALFNLFPDCILIFNRDESIHKVYDKGWNIITSEIKNKVLEVIEEAVNDS